MGGNALATTSIRLGATRYREVEAQVLQQLREYFSDRRIESIPAFSSKTDFGDLDVLLEAGEGYDASMLAQALPVTEIVRNGDVTSIGYPLAEGIFQVDVIKIPNASFDFAWRYFSFNDMGNLLGRIAHKFGAKFGHQGLLYPLRDAEHNSHLLAELEITQDFSRALQLLGYDAQRYETLRSQNGFQHLEDIFQYVVSTPYMNPDIYLFENLNNKSRVRDIKRPTYNAFLDWLAKQAPNSLPCYPWAASGSIARNQQQQAFLSTACAQFPDFHIRYQQALARHAILKQIKQRYNGELISGITGLTGPALGKLMAQVRQSFATEAEFETFFLQASDDAIKSKFLSSMT